MPFFSDAITASWVAGVSAQAIRGGARSMKKLCVSLGVVVSVVMGGAGTAWATIDNVKSFKAAYPGKEAKAYSCKTCHQNAMGKKGDLNAYGVALQALSLQPKAPVDAKKLTEADYRAIEKDDADKDGASNLDEITAGTAPGDPASVPAGASSGTPAGK